jgi:N-acetylglutamate synthase-like GNAT family acetyltransferase
VIVLRQGCTDDNQAVQDLLAACGMAGPLDPCECLIAEDRGCLAGFARVEHAGRVAYLRPIAVAADHRGQGIGRRLIYALLAKEGELRVVARGSAAGFYTALGFLPLDWMLVDPAFQAECQQCPDLADCKPVGMMRR